VALRHQAMLVTRETLHRFGRVNKIADKEKDNIRSIVRKLKIRVKIRVDKIHKVKLISY